MHNKQDIIYYVYIYIYIYTEYICCASVFLHLFARHDVTIGPLWAPSKTQWILYTTFPSTVRRTISVALAGEVKCPGPYMYVYIYIYIYTYP